MISMKDIQKKSDADLVKLLRETREKLREYRFGTAGSKGKNTREPANLKNDIARILTELNKRRHALA